MTCYTDFSIAFYEILYYFFFFTTFFMNVFYDFFYDILERQLPLFVADATF